MEDETPETSETRDPYEVYCQTIDTLENVLSDDSPSPPNERTAIAIHDALLRLKVWASDIDLESTSVLSYIGAHNNSLKALVLHSLHNMLDAVRTLRAGSCVENGDSASSMPTAAGRASRPVCFDKLENAVDKVADLAEPIVNYWAWESQYVMKFPIDAALSAGISPQRQTATPGIPHQAGRQELIAEFVGKRLKLAIDTDEIMEDVAKTSSSPVPEKYAQQPSSWVAVCMQGASSEAPVHSDEPSALDSSMYKGKEALTTEVARELMAEYIAAAPADQQGVLQSLDELSVASVSAARSTTVFSISTAPTELSRPSSPAFSANIKAVKSTNTPVKTMARTHRVAFGDRDEDESEARKRGGPRLHTPEPDEIVSDGLLACPYAKYDPVRYSEANQNLSEKAYRRCRTVYLTNIPRLKQHLYRVHRRPEYYCPSCYMAFETKKECDDHTRMRLCVLSDCPFGEKMTSDQLRAVKRRRMGETPTNAWFGIFEILFPETERPDNPYVDLANMRVTAQNAQEYVTYLENRLPQRISERLGRSLFNAESIMSQWLINMALEDTLPTVLRELHGEYRTLRSVQNADQEPD